MENAEKDGKGTYGTYSTLDATWRSIRKPLSDNGIAIYQRMLTIGGKPTLCTMILHASGEFFDDCELELKFEAGNRITGMQAMGSAVTYARRYSLQAVTGIAPTDDDDGAGAGNPKEKDPPKLASKPVPPKAQQQPAKDPAQPKQNPLETSRAFKMPSGPNKGKTLGELSPATLRALLTYTQDKLRQQSTPEMLALNHHVETVVRSLPPEPPPTDETDQGPGPDDAPPPELNDDPFPEDIPERPSEPENESQERRPRNSKAKDPAKPDIADFVIPEGLKALEDIDGVVGKPLRQIPEAVCKKMVAALDREMKKGAGGPDFSKCADVVFSIRGFLGSMGVKA